LAWTPKILSEFEIGQAVAAIESIARSDRPLAEVGCRLADPADLEHDLSACLASANETGRVWIWLRKAGDRYRFGFYSQPWVLRALELVEGTDLQQSDRDWINGLLFGYRPDAIQRYLDATQAADGRDHAPKSILQPIRTRSSDQTARQSGIRTGTDS
jgi:hypothetical protein